MALAPCAAFGVRVCDRANAVGFRRRWSRRPRDDGV